MKDQASFNKAYKDESILVWNELEVTATDIAVVAEEPLSIRVGGIPFAVIMRTPGDEIAHAAGFCLTEGVVDHRDEIGSIAFCPEDENTVDVGIVSKRLEKALDIVAQGGFISRSSCGICGKSIAGDISGQVGRINSRGLLSPGRLLSLLEALEENQPIRSVTRSTHSALLCKEDGTILAAAEDIGRHNALDKAIGKLFLSGRLNGVACAVLSSRVSYELVQKAARARIPLIVSLSRPTSLAVEMAKSLGIGMACRAMGAGLYIFSEENISFTTSRRGLF